MQVQAHTFATPTWRPTAAASTEPLDQVTLRSVEDMERDLGPELAEKARKNWAKQLEKAPGKPPEMTPVWMAGNWLSDLKPEQMSTQDHTAYVLPILRTTSHPAAPAMLEVVDRFLPTLTSARDRNHLVESAARCLRKSSEEEARQYFGMFCGALSDGGLEVRRYLATQIIETNPEHADVMQFGLSIAKKLDDGTPLGQHQASRALYASFTATRATSTPSEELKVLAAGLQCHPGNTLWSDNNFTTRYPDTVALITDAAPQVTVAQACLDALGDPFFSKTDDPVRTLQSIGQLWPERQKMLAAKSPGILLENDHLRVGGAIIRVKA